ncbi:MAG: OmpA family protein [Hoeflea sp.]|uniref:OmpA family protein n=1 Tax=Hoeflea sp. TaxID=1940281 RepID=UPI001DAE30BB|nr:OmpA family protein [Hoeflea sp.]MBU4531458.1 OmpA family protein [Alphaproteobacteria bacterium]MBU4544315.1 OmpA family protein [Alphaproteobacteria bacterium]MBU4550448.1 OmpA family protein [Alphaproteobacteria bacterium]MBV1724734.1 OmpA family protein [Hoeflea sp.]MBV1760754.1 OmpA family protein [Hoeflea sp.]
MTILRPLFALLVATGLSALVTPVAAQDNLTLVIEPYAGSEERVRERVTEAYGRTARILGFEDGKVLDERFEGRVLLMRFRNPKDRSTFEIATNYRQALEARGFTVEWQCETRALCGNGSDGGWVKRNGMNLGIGRDIDYFTGQMPYEGGTVFVSVGVERSNHYVQVLQSDAMETGQVRVLDAEAMASSLDAQGKITVENIYFDFGKADLLPESDEAIAEIARLLSDRAEIGLYVVGHTDSIGGFEANLSLARERAASVVSALESRHGVAAGRAVPAGVGPLAPVASNATEAGRALNRRVEIVLR